MKNTSEHTSWRAMCDRCRDRKDGYYRDDGVTVCPEWTGEGGFAKFLSHIGPKPTTKHTVDRIDGSKGYEPGNVRWATRQQQAANRPGFCVYVEHNGKTQTLAEWGRELGIAYETLRSRYKKGRPTHELLKTGHSRTRPLSVAAVDHL